MTLLENLVIDKKSVNFPKLNVYILVSYQYNRNNNNNNNKYL